MKLPRELRDMVWDNAFADSSPPRTYAGPTSNGPCWGVRRRGHGTIRYGSPGEEDDGWLAAGPDARNIFCSRQPHPIATVCKEAWQAFLRYNRQPGRHVWELEYSVPIVNDIYERTDSLLPILPPKDMPLVLNLEDYIKCPDRLWSRRVLEVVLAAQDDQIKLLLPGVKYFCLPLGPGEPPLPAAATAWVKKHGQRTPLVSVNDAAMWRELSDIAKYYELAWPFANSLHKKTGRRSIVKSAVGLLERIWKRENTLRLKENGEGLKPLPRIDVVVYVSMKHGNRRFSGVRGVPSASALQAYDDMVRWGV